MKLGAAFSAHGAALVVTSVDSDGSISAAGGESGDRWLTTDGDPAAVVANEWQSGARPRRPGIPLVIEALRDGRPVTLRPLWRSSADERADATSTPAPEPEPPQFIHAENAHAAATIVASATESKLEPLAAPDEVESP
jgi:predicted metalloprotease with PDZ domain